MAPITLEDEQTHVARITYGDPAGTLIVFVDGIEQLRVPVDLGDLLALEGGTAFVGFTSATGNAFENHDIIDWEFCVGAPGPPTTLAIDDVPLAEGNAGTTAFTFTITRSGPTGATTTVEVATADGTATQPGDYAAASDTLTFAPGETTKSFTVLVNGDVAVETDETFAVNLANETGATITDGTGSGTIINDDAAAPTTLAIDDVPLAEGNAGTTAFTFTITRSGPTGATTTVEVATADGTATQPGDYAAASDTLTFAPGETTKSFTVLVNGDVAVETDETFAVNLANETGATITDDTGSGTIINDDAAAPTTLAIDDVPLAEGNAGTTAFTFTITRSGPTGATTTVEVATADGTATQPGDYAAASDTLTFAPGETTKSFTVLVNGDVAVETDETFAVNLANETGATITDGTGSGTIINDDAAAPTTLAIDDVPLAEGNAGTTAFTFTITRSGPTGATTTVEVATADGTATQPGDYAAASDTLTFAPGETTKSFTVLVNGDVAVETDETFAVNLANETGATITDDTGSGTIINDDAAAPTTLAIDDVPLAEGNAGTTAFTFTITRSGPTGATTTVEVATADGTATQPGDYAAASDTLTFAPGETTKSFTVLVNGDVAVETDETFAVNLANETGATITDGTGSGTIINDDAAAPMLRIADASIVEGSDFALDGSPIPGQTTLSFPVTLSTPAASAVTVSYTTIEGTALRPSDFGPASGTLTFAPGTTGPQFANVPIVRDLRKEASETFTLLLANPNGAGFDDDRAIGTIQDDDVCTIVGSNAANTLAATSADDVICGLAGSDTVTYAFSPNPVTVDLQAGTALGWGSDTLHSIENAIGSGSGDSLSGSSGPNTLTGLAGPDLLFGRAGSDTLLGSAGADTLDGGDGIDTLVGGDGDDSLDGRAGDDNLDGSAGADAVTYVDAPNAVIVDLVKGTANGWGADGLSSIEHAIGSLFSDRLIGDGVANILSGSGGNDTLIGGAGNDELRGGDGIDTADFSSAAGPVEVNLAAGTATGWGTDIVSNVENVIGTSRGDLLTGNGAGNLLAGGRGDDRMFGADGDDTLDAGDGDDTMVGGLGADTLNGHADHDVMFGHEGNDTINGGGGIDLVSYDGADGSVTVRLDQGSASGAWGVDTISFVEDIFGSEFADLLVGTNGVNVIHANPGAGIDEIHALGGDDTVFGGQGPDEIFGGNGDDILNGNLGNDRIFGQDGKDKISGQAGNDVLSGGADRDSLSGGEGVDTLHGDQGNDTLVGGPGADQLDGDAGNDTCFDGGPEQDEKTSCEHT